jgi:hypothetical protein
MTVIFGGASKGRIDRWLAVYASDLEPLGEDARALVRRRLAARRRASRPAVILGVAALVVLIATAVRTLSAGDAQLAAHDWVSWDLVAITLLEAGFLSRPFLVRRAEARIATGLSHRVARGEHVRLAVVVGRAWIVAGVGSAGLGVAWAGALLALVRGGAVTAVWVACVVGAITVGGLTLRQAMNRPAIAVDPVSLAIDERLRAEEALAVTQPLFLVWIVLPPAIFGLPGLPFWLAKTLAVCMLVVMLLFLWSNLQHRQSRLRPATPR